ncbi:hypothetical protein AVEN_148370-1 [Araneus ventricosus]|uniref:Uncharacterized protein n=1 Tax=Araneus ventricosus TaxID=182803 RepID=A0A4Y2QI24_ARAVE|nr:hypothetical protein AVEN_148370-1 [Araneus ventricosus]
MDFHSYELLKKAQPTSTILHQVPPTVFGSFRRKGIVTVMESRFQQCKSYGWEEFYKVKHASYDSYGTHDLATNLAFLDNDKFGDLGDK